MRAAIHSTTVFTACQIASTAPAPEFCQDFTQELCASLFVKLCSSDQNMFVADAFTLLHFNRLVNVFDPCLRRSDLTNGFYGLLHGVPVVSDCSFDPDCSKSVHKILHEPLFALVHIASRTAVRAI